MRARFWGLRVGPVGAALVLGLLASIATAQGPGAGPSADSKAETFQHLGAATCAGSTCHGSTHPFTDSSVRQDEYSTWQKKDAHQNAFKLLLSPAGKRIATNLGLKDAAQSPECLTCHTDFVPEAQRGRRFAIEEGVGCEACHGGSQKWLGPHVSGTGHAENIALGLVPLEDPVVRAGLCLGCHQGSAAKPISHRMMGAGHPPLEFDLEFFTNIEPAHFNVDADYRKRKAYVPSGQTWAIGQMLAAQAFLDGLGSERFGAKGLTPELVFFDCSACHHAMRPPRWNKGLGGNEEPGQLRLADANLVLSALILQTLNLPSAQNWQASLARLHQNARESAAGIKAAAADLRKLSVSGLSEVRGRVLQRADLLKLMTALASAGDERYGGDLTMAKQIYYGLDALNRHLQQEMQLPRTVFAKPMDDLFSAVDENRQHSYDPESFRNALRQMKAAAMAESQKGAS